MLSVAARSRSSDSNDRNKGARSFPGGPIQTHLPMKPLLFSLLIASALPVLAEDAGLLIQLGLNDKESTVWDGSIKVTPGEVQDIAGWRFEKTDHIEGKTESRSDLVSPSKVNETRVLVKSRQVLFLESYPEIQRQPSERLIFVLDKDSLTQIRSRSVRSGSAK